MICPHDCWVQVQALCTPWAMGWPHWQPLPCMGVETPGISGDAVCLGALLRWYQRLCLRGVQSQRMSQGPPGIQHRVLTWPVSANFKRIAPKSSTHWFFTISLIHFKFCQDLFVWFCVCMFFSVGWGFFVFFTLNQISLYVSFGCFQGGIGTWM